MQRNMNILSSAVGGEGVTAEVTVRHTLTGPSNGMEGKSYFPKTPFE